METPEQRFGYNMAVGGHKVVKSTSYQDMQLHYDYTINGLKIETKGQKAIHAGGEKTTDRMLVEWQAVRHGDTTNRIGWVRGQADYVVFEEPDGYLWVYRPELEALAARVDWNNVLRQRPYDKDFRAYGRPGRREFGVQEPDRDDKYCFIPRTCIMLLDNTKKLGFTEALKV